MLLNFASTSDCNQFLLTSSSLLLGFSFNGIGGSVFCAFSAEGSTTADISNFTEQRFLRICDNTVSYFPLCFLFAMDELELPSRLFETGYEPTGKKRVNNYFNLRWIEVINSALEDEDLTMLNASQFGQVLKMGSHTFSVMFLHYLLSRQLITEKDFELWWLFVGKPIRYAIQDFALVTGLNCGQIAFVRSLIRSDEAGEELYRGLGDNEDEVVHHLVALARDDYAFEHNTWVGGVKTDDVKAKKGHPLPSESSDEQELEETYREYRQQGGGDDVVHFGEGRGQPSMREGEAPIGGRPTSAGVGDLVR
ncbi:hypothetical protein YC2023_072958 [Brassica napus]